MSTALIQTAFTSGEVSPSLFGHVDLARMKAAAATFRNGFVGYRGGYYSRAGTKFVGFSKQTGRSYPPRMVSFQFSINQGLALEFGNFYMRVIVNGAFVTEAALAISNITQANPAVVTYASGLISATPNTAGVSASYAPGNTVTLAGGTFTTAAVLTVTNTRLVSVALNAAGVGNYAAGNVITLAGGTQTTSTTVNVITSKVVSATIVSAGSGGSGGVYTAFGTTGSGVLVQMVVTVGGGGTVTAIGAITIPGSYTANPTNPTNEPVLIPGSGVAGAIFNIVLGVEAIALSNPGVFTANPGGGTFTQASATGTGTGATFNTAVLGPNVVAVTTPGTYSVFPTNPVSQSGTSGTGVGATFNVAGSPTYANGDWVYIAGVVGMTQVNGDTYVVAGATASTFQLHDVYGNNIDSSAFGVYTSGGTVARIYTVAAPYGEADLDYLKFTQSADVMSLTCVNQETGTEYVPVDLSRLADNNWVFEAVAPSTSARPPAGTPTVATSSAGAVTYQYVVTSVSPEDGTESIASSIGQVASAVNIAATAGTITVTWATVAAVNEYNIYKATPAVSTASVPVGALFGYAGSAYGTRFIDSNIVADFSQVPPKHKNPFARGQIVAAAPVAGGSGYTSVGFVITSSNGSGASLQGVIGGGALVAIIVNDAGQNYAPGDTVSVTGDGAGATASLTIGALSGTYPGVVAYFQQRRGYAATLNNPDTYFLSQPGAYTNFDSRAPALDSDAIIGTPWAVQVNGIQFMLPVPSGLVAFTGLSAWLLSGGGGALSPLPITPASQSATPQGHNGCSPIVPPVKVGEDILFVPAKGSLYRSVTYQITSNFYSITDIAINSAHLFDGYGIRSHAWCEEPFKLLWAVRSDGILLSDTYLRPQEVNGWGRHDTNGLFQSVCAVTEPPVDALYLAVQRFPSTHTAYMIERMDDRLWSNVEDCWCVDCGLALAQPAPAAILSASSATGLGAITGVTALVGGSRYSAATTAVVVDDDGAGPGAGALAALTIVGGAITAISFAGHNGSGYVNPALVITDPAGSEGGSGASARLTLNNAATFTASAAVFGGGDVNKIIRMGGGIARISTFTDTTHVIANILSPIVNLIPNSGGHVQPAASGDWTMTAPVTTISGLRHLAGATVTGLADGNIIPPTTVSATGTITLATAASAVTVGLAFQPQMQSVYLDVAAAQTEGARTAQGQRKKIAGVTVRMESSRGLRIGTNQPDGSTLSPAQVAPTWANLADVPDDGPNFPLKPYNALATPLRTGDVRVPVEGGIATPGQVAIQQDYPLPMQILSYEPEYVGGDTPQTQWPKKSKVAA